MYNSFKFILWKTQDIDDIYTTPWEGLGIPQPELVDVGREKGSLGSPADLTINRTLYVLLKMREKVYLNAFLGVLK